MRKPLAIVAAVAALTTLPSFAFAGGNVAWGVSVSVGGPGPYVGYPVPLPPAPVVVYPRPVYYPPPVVYAPPPAIFYPPPRVVYGPPAYYGPPGHWKRHGGGHGGDPYRGARYAYGGWR